ncbi:MAG TPA: hypothetical protein VGP42_13065 [Stellaceae bacterium]|jgi:hypothetical protein|nr:hypothetical protein [Stellaceae bacterium]
MFLARINPDLKAVSKKQGRREVRHRIAKLAILAAQDEGTSLARGMTAQQQRMRRQQQQIFAATGAAQISASLRLTAERLAFGIAAQPTREFLLLIPCRCSKRVSVPQPPGCAWLVKRKMPQAGTARSRAACLFAAASSRYASVSVPGSEMPGRGDAQARR